ncbi:SusC/RagA family TonB-linked outer membrane protein [Flavobacterium sp. RHBU_3]|uniref:SusC/RagA family TonB-linked outer membrane protein n=1 Tax=Flavobacterium sp. RHBU_3 TaxID=3391184 RepID=UPI003984A2A8
MKNTTLLKSKNSVRGQMLLLMCMSLTAGTLKAATPLSGAYSKSWLQATVKGKVTSADGLPVPGATVMVKGTTVVVSTDLDGNFEIPAASSDAVLVISSVGFKTQEIAVNGQSNINVTLAEDNQELDEVVVVGYGVKKKATVTGSISEIDGKQLTKSPAVNVSNGFAGRVSGVIASNRAGEPGYDDSSITIRGINSMNGSDVLVVVDGVPGQVGGLNRLNPQEIESITVLKDASAAIYGSRAANGVILVTTKKGKKGSRMQVSYNFDQGISSPTRLPKMADAATYAQILNEIDYYNNHSYGLNHAYTEEDIQQFRDGSDPVGHPNTDWAKETLKKHSLQSQHNLNVQGGSENTSYFFSLGKLSQEGIYRNGATHYDQYNVRTNIDTNVSDRFKVGVSLSGRKEDRVYPVASAGNIFRSIYRAYPTVAAYNPDGSPTSGIEYNNPVLMATGIGGLTENPTYVFNGILRASYDFGFLKGLSVDGFMSSDVSQSYSKTFSKPYNVYDYNQDTGVYTATIVGGSDEQATLSEQQYNQNMEVYNIKLNFKRQFGNHNVDSFVGYEQSETNTHTFGASRRHFPTVETPELSQGGAAATDYGNWGSSYNFTRQSIISRLAYNFSEKYLLDLQMRVDGSSNFPSGSRYGFFPSVSAGYRISKENWFADNVKFFDDLKIRGSWGQLGNDNTGAFQFYDNYSFNNRYVVGGVLTSGVDLTKLANPGITWERATKVDLGINARFLKNWSTEVTYFTQDRTKILWARSASIPGSTGIVNPYGSDPLVPSENIGEMKSSGIEATLGYSKQGDFSWGVSGNFTYAKNKVVYIDEASGVLDYQKQTGNPYGTYLLYDAIGIFQTDDQVANTPHVTGAQPGDLIYRDVNGDGQITADDMTRSKYGNIPQMTFGLVADASYKNFDLSVVFYGQTQVSQYVLPESGTVGNFYSSWADNRWSPTNTNGTYPRVSDRASSAVSGGQYRNNFWLNDASFVRLKNVQLGYTLPSDILGKYGISSFRVYASGFNLFTISKVKDYDPEGNSESGQFYPQQKIINLGFNVQF